MPREDGRPQPRRVRRETSLGRRDCWPGRQGPAANPAPMPEHAPPATVPIEHELYARLRAVAAAFLSRERPDHTLQPTALVHEAYVRLSSAGRLEGLGPGDLFALASRAMRCILVDHARRTRAAKRGGNGRREPLDQTAASYERSAHDLIGLEMALQRLERLEPALSEIVNLRFFGGLTEEEVAGALGVSARTVRRAWAFARLWLAQELKRESL